MSSAQASPSLHSARQTWREILFWILLGIAATELFAFWMVCSQEMRAADIRRVELQVQQMALADCLQYIPGSTIGSCTSPNEPAPRKSNARTAVKPVAVPQATSSLVSAPSGASH